MSARGLVPQQITIPFGVGLNQKLDSRALQMPSLTVCLDAQFTEQGGLQTRYPYSALEGSLTDARRIVEHNGELIAFTKDSIYTRYADQASWSSRATYLAAKVSEAPRHITTGNQADCDTARLSGMVVHTWNEGTNIYVAVTDETTGSVTLAPTAIAGTRPKLVPLSSRILIFWRDAAGKLVVHAIDPASDPTDIPSEMAAPVTVLAAASFNLFYDATRLLTTDTAAVVCRRATTSSYSIATVTAGLTVTATTKTRTCDSAIAVASTPSGTQVQVVRTDSVGIFGDFITVSAFADVTVDQALGTTTNTIEQVTAAFRSVADSGFFRCYVFWTGDTGGPLKQTKVNYVNTAGTIGTAVQLAALVTIASRAFDYDGHVFVNVCFAESSSFSGAEYAQLQNTYFLYRAPASVGAAPLLCAKMARERAGGELDAGSPLPGVQLTSGTTGFTWCGVERRIVPIGIGAYSAYSDRGPRDLSVTFDSDEARRCASLGNTLYITGGEILQYDGRQVVEVGFHVYPYQFAGSETAGGSIGANGTYSYKQTFRFDNAAGERERSCSATIANVTIAAQPGGVTFATAGTLPVTHKTSPAVAVEFWRTVVSPGDEAPFYRVTGSDPNTLTNPNGYVVNAPTNDTLATFNDELSDASISDLEAHPENGAYLEHLAPPAATIICAATDRLFLAGVAGDPHRVWYSRQRQDGEVASFHDALTVDVPRMGGDITAIAFRDGVLYVWRRAALYAFPGDGFNNLGQGQNFGPSRLLSSDVGCVSMEALAQTATGYVFKGSKGWHVLDGSSVQYIGGPISDYDSDTIVAVHVLEGQHQIRVLSTARMLVLDTNVNQWAEWTIADGLHACLWNGTYHYLVTGGVKAEQTAYGSSLTYGMDIETAWIPLGQIQGFGRVWEIKVLGEFRSAHWLRVTLSRNWLTTSFQTKDWPAYPTTVGCPLQVEHRPSIQEMQAIKIRLTAIRLVEEGDELVTYPPTGEALKLSHLALEVGLERHLARLPMAQVQ